MYEPLEEHNLAYKYLKIFIVVSIYWRPILIDIGWKWRIISILTVFVNKQLLSSNEVNLNAPLFVTWFQCIVSTIICFLLGRLSKHFPQLIKFPEGDPLNFRLCRKILPLSILFTCMIGTNNLCLKYVGVAFYYVGRSLTTCFNVVFTFILLGQKNSFNCILCCGAIIFGFWLGVDQESLTDSFSWKGVLYGILASLSVSLYSIYTKKTLPAVDGEIWLLSYYNNLYSSILFLPLIFLNGEFNDIMNYEHYNEVYFWVVMFIGGLFGFLIGFVTVLQIKVTSPLTHNISGTAKACAQTVIATEWYQESKTILWWMSNIIVLIGSASYARVKQLEMGQKHHGINQKI